jgi:hypothetical protein
MYYKTSGYQSMTLCWHEGCYSNKRKANMIRLANTNKNDPFGFLFLAVTQSPPPLSSWQKGGGGDICVRVSLELKLRLKAQGR